MNSLRMRTNLGSADSRSAPADARPAPTPAFSGNGDRRVPAPTPLPAPAPVNDERLTLLRHLVLTYNVVNRYLEEHFARYALTGAQFGVLKCLHDAGEAGLTMSWLSEMVCVSRPTMTGLIERLHSRGLIERLDSPDRRQIPARITPAGRKLVEDVSPGLFEHGERIVAGLSREECVTAAEALARLRGRVALMQSGAGPEAVAGPETPVSPETAAEERNPQGVRDGTGADSHPVASVAPLAQAAAAAGE